MLSRMTAAIVSAARRFRTSTGGNVAMMFGIMSIPIILSAGGMLDYTRAVLARSAMQDALDATALMLSKSPATITQTQVQAQALAYFNTDFVNADA